MERLGVSRHIIGVKGAVLLLTVASALLFASSPAGAAKPQLPQGVATKFAKTLVDEDYFSKKNTGYGTSWDQASPTAWRISLDWSNGFRTCAQEFKIRLIDGRTKGNASETVCSSARWPESEANASSSDMRAAARGGRLTRAEATAAAAQAVFSANGMIVRLPQPRCQRVDRTAFRCRAISTVETLDRLEDCRYRLLVTKDRGVRAEILSRRCRKSDRPYLTYRRADKAALALIDESFFRADDRSGGASRGNMTTYEMEYLWMVDDQFCLQVFKLKLIDRKLHADAGEAACTLAARWPVAT